ncbi:DUF91 domain-containing protein [Phormidium sp. CLA17]|uniref:endonuclease NucS domain-containing protein n=1 Tax=Leptolyngbya sp. Cla-17 TaxID=2803751 RepID=UPI001490F732|nr:endonuclease NucS domain-containing protein [Leptolyngbya sp. Cla-17]MBM0740930.1 DUF91 domain-containing protein [Leptolyngbya sp. Cla-17]
MRFKRTKTKVSFQSEADLEDFVWIHLEQLFGFKAFKRQSMIAGEICDILAIVPSKKLVVLELKNQADRYIVQQLTRYYDNLISQKPFSSEIDYEIPVRLIAVAPTFHRHNLIDQKYNQLEIEFLTAKISDHNDKNYFQIHDLEGNLKAEIDLYTPKTDSSDANSIEDIDERAIREEKVNKTLYHYVRVRYAHKLGLSDVSPEELAASRLKYPDKGSKLFKIQINQITPSGHTKFVSVRVPSSIGVSEFLRWVRKNIPTATGVKSSGPTWIGGFQGDNSQKETAELSSDEEKAND